MTLEFKKHIAKELKKSKWDLRAG